jgi:hypothetical protein
VTARHRDRGGIDDLALDPGRFQQTVDPEAVPAGLLDHHEPQRSAQLVLSLVLDLRQQGEQGRAVTPGHGVLGNLLAAGQVDPDQPSRPAQFKGNADRCLLGLDGGRDKGAVSQVIAGLLGWLLATSAYQSSAVLHLHGISEGDLSVMWHCQA